jgi:polysaccharide biosynthesis protein PslG
MNAPVMGLSLVGRQEIMGFPADLKKWGISSLRLPAHLPLRREDIQQLEAARDAGCFILAVLQFLPGDSHWNEALPGVIERFTPSITHWEIASEPDDPAFGWPADQLTTYAACLIKAASIIKHINPQARIHNGGLGRSLPKGIAQLCEQGAGSAVDAWNVHPYMNPLMPDAKGCLRYFQDIIRQTQSKQGQVLKPLWWSSIACPGVPDASGAAAWWLGKNPTEIMQAEWLKIVYTIAAGAGVERIFWEGWQDRPQQTRTGIDYFGLRRADGSAKPVLDILFQLTRAGL